MRINELVEKSLAVARKAGWHDPDKPTPTFSDQLALMASEVSEALEAYRVREFVCWFEQNFEHKMWIFELIHKEKEAPQEEEDLMTSSVVAEGHEIALSQVVKYAADGLKPEGFVIELADVVIRIADTAGRYQMNLEVALEHGVFNAIPASWDPVDWVERTHATTLEQLAQRYLPRRPVDQGEAPWVSRNWSVGRMLNAVTRPLIAAEDKMDAAGNPSWESSVELARALVATYRVATVLELDLNAAIQIKTAYNETREHRHGGKRI